MFESIIDYFFKEVQNFHSYKRIKTFNDVLIELNYNKNEFNKMLKNIRKYSKSNVDLIKFNTIKNAFSKYNKLHFDYNENSIFGIKILILTEKEVYQENITKFNNFIKMCEIQSSLKHYYVYGVIDTISCINGTGGFRNGYGVTYNEIPYGFISFNSEELGNHFIKYFGFYLIKALYSNSKDIKIINNYVGKEKSL